MKAKLLMLILVFLVNYSAFASNCELNYFISNVKTVITSKDRLKFESFFSNVKFIPNEDEYAYYFGVEEDDSELVDFMKGDDIKYVAFHVEDDFVIIVFYKEGVVERPIAINWHDIGDEWLKNYAALTIKKINGKWHFEATPFFFFRHSPWAEDYG
ncbi:hypothetical protein SAMN02927930_00658 [Pseudidiomarina indica]|uniref:Nuclear transport factor 2 family protein n=1 Tax=Pseudidiomarina indica TaxID=1159017 RepID=A0A1G6BAT3_9GAMM|nr:hypothetical protein [Pseudidiomarina indica]SDB17623.1 hypothetical protein SAMN02927930_00658 [Pseudidiomarina indica]